MKMTEVRMTMEEYLQLINGLSSNDPGSVQVPADKPKPKRKSSKSNKMMSKALKEANSRLRTKNGKLRKGKTQGDVMRLAHRLCKKM